ncbi:hypothetical protein [Psychromonas sp. L1A2]|uniref:hypothetical protein n=1 Tax=Psychromonas sp. L1A2 TaxID=2686356 RepID=UPI00135AD22E|nr:hypothetical protein [Psychromonas sp. L1A2]
MESRKIALSAINAEDKRYQVRDPRTAPYGEKENQDRASKDHIKGIIKTLSDNKRARLAPIEVIEDLNNKEQYIIVDGFHRYAAYSKIKERTKGGRYKQITVKVYTEGVPLERALTINTEHNALQLTNSQRDELKWQQFLNLMQRDKEPSKKETVKILGLAESTIGTWRKLRRQIIEAGFFKNGSNVSKHPITNLPMLKPSRDELKKHTDWTMPEDSEETEGALAEEDQETAYEILKKANKAIESGKLGMFITHFWGKPVDEVDLTMSSEDLNKKIIEERF